jgi:hypothetical protein
MVYVVETYIYINMRFAALCGARGWSGRAAPHWCRVPPHRCARRAVRPCARQRQRVRAVLDAHHRRRCLPRRSACTRLHVRRERHLRWCPARLLQPHDNGRCVVQRARHRRGRRRQAARMLHGHARADQRRRHQPAHARADLRATARADIIADVSRRCASPPPPFPTARLPSLESVALSRTAF